MSISDIYQLYKASSGVCTDTRNLESGYLFIALKGPHFNANEFASKALELGASYAIIDDDKYESEKTILVEDGLECLQNLARYHRSQLEYPIIGLTGSNGKTTTKELIFSVLSQKFKTKSTRGNLNNHIGVALTILEFEVDLEMGIVEMGANHQKEIEFLCSIAQPDFGLITNFGKAHLEGFGGVEGVIKGKSELYDYLKAQHKYAFINYDDPIQIQQIGDHSKVISFGKSSEVDYKIEFLTSDPYVKVTFDGLIINSRLIGEYNYRNIAVAAAIGAYFNVDSEHIKLGIESYAPHNNRSEVLTKGSNQIILDAYNANPTSMLAALKSFFKLEAEHKYLFIGDMFELGEDSVKEHKAIISYIEEHFSGPVYLFGQNFFNSYTGDQFTVFRSFEASTETLRNLKLSMTHLFIKGSRGMALERLLDLIEFK